MSFVGQCIEISNSFIRDYERVIAFAAYINKSPSQGLTLRSESRECSHTLPSRKEEDRRSGGFRGWVTHGLSERDLPALRLGESLPPETAQRFKSTMLHISFCFTAYVCK